MGIINVDDLDEEVRDYVEKLEDVALDLRNELEDAQAEITKGATPVGEEDDFDAILKSADPAVAELVKGLQADVFAAKEIAKAARNAQLTQEFNEQASTLGNLEQGEGELGALLKNLNESLEEEDFSNISKVLSDANDQIEKSGLFDEVGTSNAVSASGAEAELEAIAKSNTSGDMSYEQAYANALDENPKIYAQYLKEVG